MKPQVLADEPLFHYDSLGIAPSWHCDANCKHCFISVQQRRHDNYRADIVERVIDELPDYIKLVAFTGGEPFLHPRRFLRLLSMLNEQGRKSSVVTNALWARDWVKGETLLAQAISLGLKGISISFDDYHRPAVPDETVIQLLSKARELGAVINLKGVGKGAKKKIGIIKKAMGISKQDKEAISIFRVDHVGTAKKLTRDSVGGMKLDSCISVLMPVLSPSGELLACCTCWILAINNQVLKRGNVKNSSISEMLEFASRDYLVALLLTSGTLGILELLGARMPKGIRSRCELCVQLFNDQETVKKLVSIVRDSREVKKEITGKLMLLEGKLKPFFYDQY